MRRNATVIHVLDTISTVNMVTFYGDEIRQAIRTRKPPGPDVSRVMRRMGIGKKSTSAYFVPCAVSELLKFDAEKLQGYWEFEVYLLEELTKND